MPLPNDAPFKAIGALGVLAGAMAFRMSLVRIAQNVQGKKFTKEEEAKIERFSEMQLLNAEWIPIGTGLMLAVALRGTSHPCLFKGASVAFAVGRYVFSTRLFFTQLKHMFPVSFLGMNLTYISTFVLSGLLLAQ